MLELRNQTLLIISPHPDDEVLGCGGLIQKIKENGGKVYILFLTVGVTMDYSELGISTAQERLNEIEKVTKYLKYDGFRIAFFGDDYHLKLDQVPQKDIINEIENGKEISLNTIKPTIVAAPARSDYNQDHFVATQAVLAATRPAPNNMKHLSPIVLGYESVQTAGWWDNNSDYQNIFLPMSDKELTRKTKALQLYKTQVREGHHPRSVQSIRNLAYYRGMFAGEKAAEAYIGYRIIL
jgi:LmbE family N-acetylglucosaminyl deacetylase